MKSTTRFSKNIRGIECLNCRQPISDNDNFCSNCGQVNDELPLSIKQFISEFFSGFFSFDTRFFKTFIPLIFKPGKVSREYIEGKRKRYVNPFQLYLHVTILYFLIQGLFSAFDEYKLSNFISKNENEVTEVEKDSILNNVEQELAKNNIKLDLFVENDTSKKQDSLNTIAINSTQPSKNNKANFDFFLKHKNPKIRDFSIKTKSFIDSSFQKSILLNQLKNSTLTKKEKDSVFNEFYNEIIKNTAFLVDAQKIKELEQLTIYSKIKEFNTTYIESILKKEKIEYEIPKEHKISVEDGIIKNFVGDGFFKKISDFMTYDKAHEDSSVSDALEKLNYKKTRWNIFYYKKAQDFNKFKEDKDFRSSYTQDVVSKISIALFFMLPVFTFFLSLLYYRHKYNYTEHLVFVFNVQTVFFILLIIFTIFDRVLFTDIGTGIFQLIFLFYLYKSLRNFYKQKRFKTFVKFILLNTIFMFLAFIGLVIIGFISFAL